MKALAIIALLACSALQAVAQEYTLYISGTQVTSANANDVLGDGGSVRYDASTKTLTLHDANIYSWGGWAAIESVGAVKTIVLEGNNRLRNEISLKMDYGEGVTIEGSNINSDRLDISNVHWGIGFSPLSFDPFEDDPTQEPPISLTIKNCEVYISAAYTAISGSGAKGELTIEKASVTAEGQSDGSITYLSKLTLGKDVYITSPVGAVFNEEIGAVTLDGSTPTCSQVVISYAKKFDELPANSIYIYQKDGTIVSYAFDDAPVITYSDDCLVLSTASTTVQYHLSTLRKLTMASEWDLFTGVDNIVIPDTEFSFTDEGAKVRGEKPGTLFYVFDMKGMKCAQGTIDAEGKANIPLNSLSSGIYIVKTQSTSFKIKR